MTDQMEQIDAALQTREATTNNEFRALANGATTKTQQLHRQFEDTSRDMKRIAQDAAARIRQLDGDDTIYPEGRNRLIAETADAAKLQIRKLEDQHAALLAVMGKELEAASLPRLDKGREMQARDEARMILDGSADPVRTMGQLASRGDEVAAVLVGSYGESYLRARGFTPKDAREGHSTVKTVAVGAARNGSDPVTRGAATAYFAMDSLKGVAAVTRELAWGPLKGVGVTR